MLCHRVVIHGPPFSKGTEAICRVPSIYLSHRLSALTPIHLCWFGVRLYKYICYFLENISLFIKYPIINKCKNNSRHIYYTHRYLVLTNTFGAESLYTVYRAVETLEFSAILVFTGYDVTHVSILTSDISSIIHIIPSTTYGTFCYPNHLYMIGRRFGTYL